jgi:hypothetical protein
MDSQVIPWIAVIFIIVFFAAYRFGKRRGEDLQRFARQRGLSFSARAGSKAEEEFADFLLFSDNSDRKLSNIIRGEMDGVPVIMFDFQATTGVGQSASTHRQSVVIMQPHSSGLPDFEMYPKGMLFKVFRIFSKKEIEFPSRSGFSEAYALKSADEDAVRKVFPDMVLSYFEKHKGLTVEVKGGRLLYYRNGKLTSPDEVKSFLQQGLEIIKLFQ